MKLGSWLESHQKNTRFMVFWQTWNCQIPSNPIQKLDSIRVNTTKNAPKSVALRCRPLGILLCNSWLVEDPPFGFKEIHWNFMKFRGSAGTAAQLHCLEACASAKAKAALWDAAPSATFHSGHESLKLWIPQQMTSALAAHKSPVRIFLWRVSGQV